MHRRSGPTAAIVGAGVSGLTQAHALLRCGYEVVVFERTGELGGVWSQFVYPGVSLQNSHREYRHPDFEWPFPHAFHPSGEETKRYWECFARHFGIHVRLRTEVVAAAIEADGGWRVTARDVGGDGGRETTERFDFLVVATGMYAQRALGRGFAVPEHFPGAVLTERDIVSPEQFRDKTVVVSGFGKSALDALRAARNGGARRVVHLFRTPRWPLPSHLGWLDISTIVFWRFTSTFFPGWHHPTRAGRALHVWAPWLVWLFWALLRAVLLAAAWWKAGWRAWTPAGARRLRAITPPHALALDLRSSSAIATDAYFRDIAQGRIEPVRGELRALAADGAVVVAVAVAAGGENDKGNELRLGPADVVVLAWGAGAVAVPYLPPALRRALEAEGGGENGGEAQLFRHLVHPDYPTLGFAGFNHCWHHVPACAAGAAWLCAYFAGRIVLPPREQTRRDAERILRWKLTHSTYEPAAPFGLSMHFQQYMDVLMQDLGLPVFRKRGPCAAFRPYGAGDYAGVVDAVAEALRGPGVYNPCSAAF